MKMPKKMIKINESFCFAFHNGNLGIQMKAVEYYKNHLELKEHFWVKDNSVPIILDTNVLLNAYFYSKQERQQFIKFLNANHSRIYIVSQVDTEFQRKRPNYKEAYSLKLKDTAKTLCNFLEEKNEVIASFVKKLSNFKQTPIIRFDYPDNVQAVDSVIESLNKWKSDNNEIVSTLIKDVDDKLKELSDCILSDTKTVDDDADFLLALSNCQFTEELQSKEKEFLSNLYAACSETFYKMQNSKDIRDADKHYTFPGRGDRDKLKEGKEAEGDFYIYHEILKVMKSLKKDVIFLTNDLSKKDWVNKELFPFDHYIANCYNLTNHVFYVVDGKTLPLASILFDSETNVDDESDGEDGVDAKHRYREISQEAFLSNLKTCIAWAESYGAQYVSKDYFIYCILGRKKYEFDSSRKILEELIEMHQVEIYKQDDKDCLRLLQ